MSVSFQRILIVQMMRIRMYASDHCSVILAHISLNADRIGSRLELAKNGREKKVHIESTVLRYYV